MLPIKNPHVLITRPRAAADDFATLLKAAAAPFKPFVLPAFELVSTDVHVPDFAAAIFTSRAGVSFAPSGAGRTAYCVGGATANAAQRRGYNAQSAAGSAADLCEVILRESPKEQLLHIRGESTVGDVRATLSRNDLQCDEVVAYRKEISVIGPQDVDHLRDLDQCILPVFSAETVSIIASWPLEFPTVHIVAISSDVARHAERLRPASVTISDRPDVIAMVAQTARLIA